MEWWKVIGFVLIVLIVLTVWQKGLDTFKNSPTQSVWDTTKGFIDKAKTIKTNTTANLGKINCITNESCNTAFSSCNNNCLCLTDGSCEVR